MAWSDAHLLLKQDVLVVKDLDGAGSASFQLFKSLRRVESRRLRYV